jgi:hypothetical protein
VEVVVVVVVVVVVTEVNTKTHVYRVCRSGMSFVSKSRPSA